MPSGDPTSKKAPQIHRAQLELRFAVALAVMVIVSFSLLVPAIFYRPIWRWQNRVVDWAEEWGFEPIRRLPRGSLN